ncbi:hypothetical protein UlMin_044425 [Ulmus minor]
MEPENIDWENIDSVFEEDEAYESINAPKWFDFLVPDEQLDDQAWFCKSDCKHPKTPDDFAKSKLYTKPKVKLLRSVSFSEILPFKDRNRRYPHPKIPKEKGSNFPGKSQENTENRNPNFIPPIPSGKPRTQKPATALRTDKKKQVENPSENSTKPGRMPRLKQTFSAGNLFAGKEILNQITEFCSGLKKFARRGSKSKKWSSEKGSGVALNELKERIREKERRPLLVKEQKL